MIQSLITTRFKRPLQAAAWGLLFLGGLAMSGCQKPLDPQEYGEVIYELPKLPGASKPFPLPQLDEVDETEPEASK